MVHTVLLRLERDFILSGAHLLLYKFLLAPTLANYDALLAGVVAAKAANATVGGIRYLMTLADGTTLIDTSTKTANTFQNFKDKIVNETHFTRLAIATALLSASGIGEETKFSSSTNLNETYYATRVGRTPYDAMGVLRISITE